MRNYISNLPTRTVYSNEEKKKIRIKNNRKLINQLTSNCYLPISTFSSFVQFQHCSDQLYPLNHSNNPFQKRNHLNQRTLSLKNKIKIPFYESLAPFKGIRIIQNNSNNKDDNLNLTLHISKVPQRKFFIRDESTHKSIINKSLSRFD